MTGLVRYPAPISAVSDLNDLTDVIISAPEEFQVLEYNGTNWVNTHASSSVYVRNAESTTLTTGTVVYLFGATGDHATVKRADNDSDATSSKTVGVVSAPIDASENGVIVTQGYVDGIDLSSGYTAGDVLWLGEDGTFTTTKPTAPEHLVFIGVVVRATSNGIIYVSTQNGYELDELHNVQINSGTVASGDFLKYNGSLWVNDPINLGTDTVGDYVASLVAGNGITLSNNSGEGATPTINAGATVSDSTPSSPTTGQIWYESDTGATFVYTGSAWVEVGATQGPYVCTSSTRPSSPYEGMAIYETDTDKVLVYNGTAWYPNWNQAWGVVGVAKLGTIFTTSSNHTVKQDTGLSVTISAVSGRMYRITVSGNFYPSGGLQTMVTNIVWGGSEIALYNMNADSLSSGNSHAVSHVFYHQASSTGSTVVKTQLAGTPSNTAVSDYGNSGSNQYRVLIVEDMGPA